VNLAQGIREACKNPAHKGLMKHKKTLTTLLMINFINNEFAVRMKMAVFWVVPRSLVALMTDEASTSETGNFHQTTWDNPEDSHKLVTSH
jgi:hypothetical protein